MSYAGSMGRRVYPRGRVASGHQDFLGGLLGLGGGDAAGASTRVSSQGSATYSPPLESSQAYVVSKAQQAISAINAATAAQLADRAGISAVRIFQTAYGQGLTVDGRYGTNTRAALLRVVPNATLPGGSAPRQTRPYVDSGGAAIVDPVAQAAMDEAPTRPAWVVPALAIGGVVLLGSGLLLVQRGRSGLRSNRLRRNCRRGR